MDAQSSELLVLVQKLEKKTERPSHPNGSVVLAAETDPDLRMARMIADAMGNKRGHPRYQINKRILREIRQLAAQGDTVQQIAYKLGFDPLPVQRAVKENRIKIFERYSIKAFAPEMPNLYFKNIHAASLYFHQSASKIEFTIRAHGQINGWRLCRGNWNEHEVGFGR